MVSSRASPTTLCTVLWAGLWAIPILRPRTRSSGFIMPILIACGISGLLRAADGRIRPTAAWLNTTFTFFDENGTAVNMTGQQVVETAAQLGYRYDDDPPLPPQEPIPVHPPHAETRPGHVKRTPLSRPSPENAPRHMLDEQVSHASVLTLERSRGDAKICVEAGHVVPRCSPDHRYPVRAVAGSLSTRCILTFPTDAPRSPKSPYFIGNLSFFALKPHHGTPNAPRLRGNATSM